MLCVSSVFLQNHVQETIKRVDDILDLKVKDEPYYIALFKCSKPQSIFEYKTWTNYVSVLIQWL